MPGNRLVVEEIDAAEPEAVLDCASAKIPFKDDMWQLVRAQEVDRLSSMTGLSNQMAAMVVDRAAAEAAHHQAGFYMSS